MSRFYICIDLKSFYASVECVERGLDPMTCDLVVADPSRTDKTICLAVSTSLKAKGVKNRCRLFEIPKNFKYIIAPPQMQKYIDYSADIYGIYLKYFSKEDIHVYSIDEAFIDITDYLSLYSLSPKEIAVRILDEIRRSLKIHAACGIGTNLYLAKVALDISAKHSPDFIAFLDEDLFKKTLWDHKPLTDFWRIGNGTAKRLERRGIYTMRHITQADESLLYKLFGVDAELIIDHANGRESTTIADIKNYKSKSNCITSGQVLMRDYSFKEGLIIVKEMADNLCIELAVKHLLTCSLTLHVGYSNSLDILPAHGTIKLIEPSSSAAAIIPAIEKLYRNILDPNTPIKRIYITCSNVLSCECKRQFTFFEDEKTTVRDSKLQDTVLNIKNKYGRNAILKGMNLQKAATGRERNQQIGGHRSG